MIETKYQRQQRIHIRRGIRERDRRKKFLYLKHSGQLENYYRQKAGIKVKKTTIKDYERVKPKVSRWKQFVIKLKYYGQIILRRLRKRDQTKDS